jgi:hypothetical protein
VSLAKANIARFNPLAINTTTKPVKKILW